MVKAISVLHGDNPSINITGTIVFTQESGNEPTHIDIEIKGLAPGEHGFHIQ